jgi:hypothetical protein
MTTTPPNEAVELFKLALGPISALIGIVGTLLAGWVADRRRFSNEREMAEQREHAVFVGLFAIRNHVLQAINEYEGDHRAARLEPLRTAQSYVQKIIDRAPTDSDRLMIVIVEIGLAIDTLLAALDSRGPTSALTDPYILQDTLSHPIEKLVASLEQFDLISSSSLDLMSDEELSKFPGYRELPDEPV